jgi:hypothetical protein
MDLPLATPELDHDALPEIISSFSTRVKVGGYSPPPTRTWKRFPLLQIRRSTRVLPQSLISLIYQLVARPCPRLLTAKTIFLLIFSRLFSLLYCLADLSMSLELPPFFPSSARLCGYEPQFVVKPRILTYGYATPSPH